MCNGGFLRFPSVFFLTLYFLSFLSLSSSRPCYSFISACTPENLTSESLAFRFVENNAIKAEYITLVKLLICVSGAPGLNIGQETKYAKGICGFFSVGSVQHHNTCSSYAKLLLPVYQISLQCHLIFRRYMLYACDSVFSSCSLKVALWTTRFNIKSLRSAHEQHLCALWG